MQYIHPSEAQQFLHPLFLGISPTIQVTNLLFHSYSPPKSLTPSSSLHSPSPSSSPPPPDTDTDTVTHNTTLPPSSSPPQRQQTVPLHLNTPIWLKLPRFQNSNQRAGRIDRQLVILFSDSEIRSGQWAVQLLRWGLSKRNNGGER